MHFLFVASTHNRKSLELQSIVRSNVCLFFHSFFRSLELNSFAATVPPCRSTAGWWWCCQRRRCSWDRERERERKIENHYRILVHRYKCPSVWYNWANKKFMRRRKEVPRARGRKSNDDVTAPGKRRQSTSTCNCKSLLTLHDVRLHVYGIVKLRASAGEAIQRKRSKEKIGAWTSSTTTIGSKRMFIGKTLTFFLFTSSEIHDNDDNDATQYAMHQ